MPPKSSQIDLGWRVYDLGWRVSDLGWRVYDLGWRVYDLGWHVYDLGWRVYDLGWRVCDLGWRVSDLGWRVSDLGWGVLAGPNDRGGNLLSIGTLGMFGDTLWLELWLFLCFIVRIAPSEKQENDDSWCLGAEGKTKKVASRSSHAAVLCEARQRKTNKC